MTRVLDRLAEPRNMRRLLTTFVVLVVAALALGAVALVREVRTADRVTVVQGRVTAVERPLTRTQLERAVDRTIRDLTLKQRRRLLRRLLTAATRKQRAELRALLRVRGLPPRSVVPPPPPPPPPVRVPSSGPLAPLAPQRVSTPTRPPAPAPPAAPPPAASAPPPPSAPRDAAPPAPPAVAAPTGPPGNGHGNANGRATHGDPQPEHGRDGKP